MACEYFHNRESTSPPGCLARAVPLPETFALLKIPLASHAEQQRIANCLTTLDDLIAAQTQKLDDASMERLFHATRDVLHEWTDRLRAEAAADFPRKVTAFRPGMAVHGRFRQPCPVCGTPVQRIVYAENECNYCPVCQTGGVVLADRALSRLLHKSWPREV